MAWVFLRKGRGASPEKRAPGDSASGSNSNQTAVHRHVLSSEECRLSYRDSDFTVVCRARSLKHLEILEAVHIGLSHPSLCVQKSSVVSLSLLSNLNT